uniref:Uncharacterized protein n=1 Tax=Aegilops tauschii subsp. strangulata TaxID=200361 RepID=A0A453DAD0_AEGTS
MQELQQTKSKEGCGNAHLPHEHVITKNVHAENNLAVQQGGPEPSLRLQQVTNQNDHAQNSNATKPHGHHQVTKQVHQ